MKKEDKKRVITTLVECANKYKENLKNKCLLFICMDKHKKIIWLEVSFDASNFLHLTGCKCKEGISAKDFYRRCLHNRLRVEDFTYAEDGTTQMKLEVLPWLLNQNLSANCIGDYCGNMPKLYTEKMVGSVRAGLGFVQTKSGRYVPNTVLKVDIRQYIRNPLRIIVTYRKDKTEIKYKEIVYKAKNVEWSTIEYPLEIKQKIG